jgi:CheY-like chemotaxis protein
VKLLLADDDATSRRVLRAILSASGYEVIEAEDGMQAWSILSSKDAPNLVLLDWMMPGLDGVDICRRLRARANDSYSYVLLITSKAEARDVVAGLEAGADDYLTKPCNPDELRCRVRAGERILLLKTELEKNIAELEEALAHVERLQGLLPICMHCKSIRDDSNIWHRIETYIEKHSDAMFTHALCLDCLRKHYPEYSEYSDDASVDDGRVKSRRAEHEIVSGLNASEPEGDATED